MHTRWPLKLGFGGDAVSANKHNMLSLYSLDSRVDKRWKALAQQCQQILTEQQIALESPATILRDVATLIQFLGPDGVVTKGRNGNLPLDCLPELNRRSSYPTQPGLTRAMLRDYPNVSGTFILLRVMDMLQARGNRLVVCSAALEFWRRLNPAEQYFALLEALLFQAQTAVLGGEIRSLKPQEFRTTVLFLAQLNDGWRNFHLYEASQYFGLPGELPPWYLFLLRQFGLVEIRPRSAAQREQSNREVRGWLLGGARLTTWGTAVAWALLELWKVREREEEDYENSADQPEADREHAFEPGLRESPEALRDAEEFGVLQPVFQPYFPEWQTVFAHPKREDRSGTYLFKVTLGGGGGIWRRLAVPSDLTLDALAGAILSAFGLDEDHLYNFRYRDQRGNSRLYAHPYTDEGPFTSEVTVAGTDLALKAEMEFTFDFGSYWQFKVLLEDVVAGADQLEAVVIESAGPPPKQYPVPES